MTDAEIEPVLVLIAQILCKLTFSIEHEPPFPRFCRIKIRLIRHWRQGKIKRIATMCQTCDEPAYLCIQIQTIKQECKR